MKRVATAAAVTYDRVTQDIITPRTPLTLGFLILGGSGLDGVTIILAYTFIYRSNSLYYL